MLCDGPHQMIETATEIRKRVTVDEAPAFEFRGDSLFRMQSKARAVDTRIVSERIWWPAGPLADFLLKNVRVFLSAFDSREAAIKAEHWVHRRLWSRGKVQDPANVLKHFILRIDPVVAGEELLADVPIPSP